MRKYNSANRPSMRRKIWQSMRILRRFTVPDLIRTVPGATVANVQSFVSRLFTAGILNKNGEVRRGYAGEYQAYTLVIDSGPDVPVLATGRHKKKKEEKEKENEINQEVEQGVRHDTA